MAGRPKGTGGQVSELTSTQLRRIDKCLQGTRYELRNRALLYLGLGTGMRIAEMVSLRVRDVRGHDRLHRCIVLARHGTGNGESRTVWVSKQAVACLRTYLNSSGLMPDDPLFPGGLDPPRRMNVTYAVQLLGKIFRDAGVRNASSHSLRRTHANALRRSGADLMIIKEQLGHSSLATTQRYFAVDPIETQQAVDRLQF